MISVNSCSEYDGVRFLLLPSHDVTLILTTISVSEIFPGDPDLVAAVGDLMPRLQAGGVSVFLVHEGEEQLVPEGFLPIDLTSQLASADAVPRDIRKGTSWSDAALFFYTSGTTGESFASCTLKSIYKID